MANDIQEDGFSRTQVRSSKFDGITAERNSTLSRLSGRAKRQLLDAGRFELVPVRDITLDRKNPRIARILEMYGEEPTPEQINLALGAGTEDENSSGPTFEKLKQSILTNGSIIQPVILNRTPDGQIVCIEGNTRVSLYKSFLDQQLPGSWDRIPALVHSNIDDGDMDAIRLQAHLVGPRAWDPYAKAKYLHELRTRKHMPWNAIVDYCGGRPKELAESIQAYVDMESFYRPILPDDTRFDATRFSGFVELQKAGVKDAIASAGHTLTDFAQWVDDERIYPLNTVRLLPRLLKNAEARKIFLKDGARKAASILEKPDLSKSLQEADISQLSRALVEKIMKIPYQDMVRLKSGQNTETQQSIAEAADVLRDFALELDGGSESN
jgi:hypothetical protein